MYEAWRSGRSSPVASPPTQGQANEIIQKLHPCLLHTLNLTPINVAITCGLCEHVSTGQGSPLIKNRKRNLCAYTAVSRATLKLARYIYSKRMLERWPHYETIIWKCSGENTGLFFREEIPFTFKIISPQQKLKLWGAVRFDISCFQHVIPSNMLWQKGT